MILEIENLYKQFGSKVIFDGLNLKIEKPGIIALVAPNGTGKTTLMNGICNIEKMDSGMISVLGMETDNPALFHSVSYMQDNSVLYEELSGRTHIQLIKDAHGLNDEQVEQVLDRLKMTDYLSKRVRDYSLGMKQHLLFAMSVLPKPKLLILDEPINGLDPASVIRVREMLTELHQNGTAILLSSHNLDQIEQLTQDVIFLKDGILLDAATISSNQRMSVYQFIIDLPAEFEQVLQDLDIEFSRETEHKYVVEIPKDRAEEFNMQLQKKHICCFDRQEIKKLLNDVYFELFGGV